MRTSRRAQVSAMSTDGALPRLAAALAAGLALASPSAAEGKPERASSAASGASPSPSPAVSAATATASEPARALGSLPKPPSLDVPPPTPATLETLDTALAHLTSKDPGVRETAIADIHEVEPDLLPAIHRRLTTLAESSDHEAMRDVLTQVRDKTRDQVRGAADKDKDAALDYLTMLESRAKPDSKNWRDLVSVVGMARMLRQMETVSAARELVGIYARFGEFLRLEMQRQVEQMGGHAVAALIEAERHPAPKIAQWARRQLDTLGKGIPGEAVQTSDPQSLADILRAYGRARDPDAARLVISFANSERTQIREAARQAVVLMGEVATWQLRDTYENVVGKKPSREWSWERTARELFGEFDRLRLAEVYAIFEDGLAKQSAGKLDDMATAFDQVLARSPYFERAPEMIPGYLAYADSKLDDAKEKAARALRRVQRLAPTGDPAVPRAESLLLTLEADSLFDRHVADQTLVRRAAELDPSNSRARALLARMTRVDADVDGRLHRVIAAAAVGVVALLAVLVILLRKRPPEAPANPTKTEEPGEAPGS